MYSCATTKETREEQLQMLLDGETVGLKVNCPRGQESSARSPLMMLHALPGRTKEAVAGPGGIEHVAPEFLHDARATETTSEGPKSESGFS